MIIVAYYRDTIKVKLVKLNLCNLEGHFCGSNRLHVFLILSRQLNNLSRFTWIPEKVIYVIG